MLFSSNFSTVDIPASSGINIHGVKGGAGPPLLLIHGFPQTHAIWNKVATPLSEHYTVIALDLRGYGRSSKPQAAKDRPEDHSQYSKNSMATDMLAAMKHLGYDRFFVCGHDRGARVAHALSTNHPSAVIALLLLDICPTLAQYDQTNQAFASYYWHWFFLIQACPFPEDAITAAPDTFALKQMGGGKHEMGEEAWKEYEDQFRDWKIVHAMCEDYRAAAKEDMDEQRANLERGKKIQCPTRVLWGKKSVIEILYDPRKEWAKVVAEGKFDAKGSSAVEGGHYIPEEQPEVLVQHIQEFLRQ